MNCIKILSVTHIEIIVLFGYRKLRDRHYQPLGCGPHYWILEWKWRGIVDTNNWWFGKYYFLNNVNCLWSKDRLALPFDIVTVKSRLHGWARTWQLVVLAKDLNPHWSSHHLCFHKKSPFWKKWINIRNI